MDTEWQFAGLRFLDVRDLRGAAVLDADGMSLEASAPCSRGWTVPSTS